MTSLTDFDERTSDDWDVDMSAFFDPEDGDQDAQDFLQIRREKRRWKGIEDKDHFVKNLGHFEKHTKVQ